MPPGKGSPKKLRPLSGAMRTRPPEGRQACPRRVATPLRGDEDPGGMVHPLPVAAFATPLRGDGDDALVNGTMPMKALRPLSGAMRTSPPSHRSADATCCDPSQGR